MKKCSKCQQLKPTSEYQNDKSRKDGLNAKCKECTKQNKRNTEYMKTYYQLNREKLDAKTKIATFKYRIKDGLGIYLLWNKIDQCVDRVGEGQFKYREMCYRRCHENHPIEINNNVKQYGFDNVYEFRKIEWCDNEYERKNKETQYINQYKPKYNYLKYQYNEQ